MRTTRWWWINENNCKEMVWHPHMTITNLYASYLENGVLRYYDRNQYSFIGKMINEPTCVYSSMFIALFREILMNCPKQTDAEFLIVELSCTMYMDFVNLCQNKTAEISPTVNRAVTLL